MVAIAKAPKGAAHCDAARHLHRRGAAPGDLWGPASAVGSSSSRSSLRELANPTRERDHDQTVGRDFLSERGRGCRVSGLYITSQTIGLSKVNRKIMGRGCC